MLPLQYTIPSEANLDTCEISDKYIKGEGEPKLTHKKESKKTPSKEIKYNDIKK